MAAEFELNGKQYTTKEHFARTCAGCVFAHGDHSECAEAQNVSGKSCGLDHVVFIEVKHE